MGILVTGGAGFVGFNVVEALLESGRDVTLFDRGKLPEPSQRALALYGSRIVAMTGDVCSAQDVSEIFARNAIDGVIHCAAVTSGAARETSDLDSVMDVNLKGVINILDAARRNRVRRIVYTSSSMVYGESSYRLPRLYEDSTPTIPITLYAITKYAAERLCLLMRALWDVDVVCARLGTVVGPWERATGVRDSFGTHTQLALCAATGKQAILPRHEVRRDWVYSRDVAAGLMRLLDAPSTRNTVYNLSSGLNWGSTVLKWCTALRTLYKDFEFRIAAEGEMPNITYTDKDRYPMDMGRMNHEFGFQPRDPDTAYADFIKWISHTPDFWKM